MNWKSAASDSVREKISYFQKSKIKFLMVLILTVTFEHSYTILSFFAQNWVGRVSTFGLVVWLDLMIFYSFDLIKTLHGRRMKFFSWLVFSTITFISGFLNVYYMIYHRPGNLSEMVGQILSVVIGGVSPLGIIFLGAAYSTADETIAKAEVHRINRAENEERKVIPSVVNDERDVKIIEMYRNNKPVSAIADETRLSRQTIYNILKKNGLMES